MPIRILIVIAAMIAALIGSDATAEDELSPSDSIRDTTVLDSVRDSLPAPPSGSLQDKLMEKAGLATKPAKPAEPPVVPVSYFDSSLAWLCSPRLNLRSWIDRGSYRSAADYARFDQMFAVVDYDDVPMRAVVQPYGLPGSRLSVVQDGVRLAPFEHVPEPDGTLDLYDIPTALDDAVFFVPGGHGFLLGGAVSSGTLVTQSSRPNDNEAHSAFLVRKGDLGYSHARARYVRRFRNERRIGISVDYRNVDANLFSSNPEDAYTYTGELYVPVTRQWALDLNGYLYRRGGTYKIRPFALGRSVGRNRSDRQLLASLVRHNKAGTVRTAIGYEYVRQQSNLETNYRGRFALDTRGGFVERQWAGSNRVMRARIEARSRLWSDGAREFRRFESEVRWSLVRKLQRGAYGIHLGGIAVERFDPSPVGALAWNRETNRTYLQLSAAYGERQPTLHEQHLQRQRVGLYGGSFDYGDEGNPGLTPERQMSASLISELGSTASAMRMSAAVGRIADAIDWIGEIDLDSLGGYRRFRPINSGIEYFSVAGGPRFSFGQTLFLAAGAGYNYVTFDTLPDRPYQPTYRVFAATELHWYWKPKLIHLWGYAEASWIGKYHGFETFQMGEELVVNAKVSFQMNRFRFYVAHENLFGPESMVREDVLKLTRIFTYGFEWQFLN